LKKDYFLGVRLRRGKDDDLIQAIRRLPRGELSELVRRLLRRELNAVPRPAEARPAVRAVQPPLTAVQRQAMRPAIKIMTNRERE